jgi:hypothetical protein
VRPRLSLSSSPSLSPNLKRSPNLKPSTRLNLGPSLRGIRHRHGSMCLIGLSWVNGCTIHGGFVNRSGALQSNAGAIAVFEVPASIRLACKNILYDLKQGTLGTEGATGPGDLLGSDFHFQPVDQPADTIEWLREQRSMKPGPPLVLSERAGGHVRDTRQWPHAAGQGRPQRRRSHVQGEISQSVFGRESVAPSARRIKICSPPASTFAAWRTRADAQAIITPLTRALHRSEADIGGR